MKKEKIKKLKYKQKGSLLIGAILVMGLIGVGSIWAWESYKEKQIVDKAKLAGEQIRLLGQATDEYISIHRDKIANLQSDGNIKCQQNGLCELTIIGLKQSGELPSSFSEHNSWGSEYKIQIKREGTPPDYKISGIIVTADSPTTKSMKILGYATKEGGANAGNNLIDINKITGNAGLWSFNPKDFNIISNTKYQLAYRVGYNASQYSPYLRRDGSLPMTGPLDMAWHNVRNIDNLNAKNGQINDSLNISGRTTTGNLHVNGDTTMGGKLTGDVIPRQTVSIGQSCSPNGLLGKDHSGMLLNCVNGVWGAVGSQSSGIGDYLYFTEPRKFPKNTYKVDDYYCMITGFKHIGGVTNSYYSTISLINGYWSYGSAGGTSPILCIKRH